MRHSQVPIGDLGLPLRHPQPEGRIRNPLATSTSTAFFVYFNKPFVRAFCCAVCHCIYVNDSSIQLSMPSLNLVTDNNIIIIAMMIIKYCSQKFKYSLRIMTKNKFRH